MEFLYNNSLINQIIDKLFRHRRNDYPQQNLQYLMHLGDVEHELHHVVNPNQQKLYTSIFKRTQQPEICIVYMHGYGSNRLECANIVRVLPQICALCCFDFSGSGKSEGETTTYGIKQKEDINSIIKYLRILEFKRFILWGRSMGATSLLLYSNQYQPEDIILQIVDSAFYSFQSIAFQIANKNVKAPQFIISFAIQMAKKNCQKLQYNPFSIEFSNFQECQIPTLFVYHQEDDVINCKNTHLLCSNFKGQFQKLAIEQNHNTARSLSTIYQIFSFVDKYYKKYKKERIKDDKMQYSSRNYCYTSRSSSSKGQNSVDSNCSSKPRKGIQRVANEPSPIEDYGMLFVNNIMTDSPQPNHVRRKYSSCKRNNLNSGGQPNSKKQIESTLMSLMQVSKQTSQMCQLNSKLSSPKKQKRKISTVKSLEGSRYSDQS